MTRKMKKLASLVLTFVMVFAMAAIGKAESQDFTITAPDNGHSYKVYQIFKGDLHEGKLSNVKWGANGKNGAASVTKGDSVPQEVLENLASVTSAGSNKEKLDVIKNYVDFESTPHKTIAAGQSESVCAGYYLIQDAGAGENTAVYSTHIVKIVGDITIAPKGDTPEVKKKVKDVNDTIGTESGWIDSADYDIGDEVPFQFTTTVVDNYADYESYTLEFHDRQSPGLSFNEGSVTVYVDDVQIEDGYEIVTNAGNENWTFEIKFENLKNIEAVHAGSVIRIEYTSTLKGNVEIGYNGNPNTVFLRYSNNPYSSETCDTPEDTVIVFTYELDIHKVRKAAEGETGNQPLAGADFTLEKYTGNGWKTISKTPNEAGTTFAFAGLDDGRYRLRETVTPAGYNTIEDIYFNVEASHEEEADEPKLTDLTITFTDAEGNALPEGGSIQFTPVNNDIGHLEAEVLNQSGIVLPETGGSGTTMFYLIGGILTAGAAVVLVTRKRMRR